MIDIKDEVSNTILEKQREDFIDKFGREPGPQDPVFFDPTCDVPVAITESKLTDMYHTSILSTVDAYSKEDN